MGGGRKVGIEWVDVRENGASGWGGTARMNSNECHAQFALYVLCKLDTLLGGRVVERRVGREGQGGGASEIWHCMGGHAVCTVCAWQAGYTSCGLAGRWWPWWGGGGSGGEGLEVTCQQLGQASGGSSLG